MLFKIDETLIDLTEVVWIDLYTFNENSLAFYFINNDEPLNLECIDIDKIINDLKEYKSMFYPINSDTLINLKLVRAIKSFTDSKDRYYVRIFTKDNDTFLLSLDIKDSTEMSRILEEMSRL